MQIQEQDTYHGSALMQIVEHDSFKALNRASSDYGHYLINTDRQVFVKYSTKSRSPWQFTFQGKEIAALQRAGTTKGHAFLCVVCGRSTICALTMAELAQVLDLTSHSQQTITVNVPKGGSCHVHGTSGKLVRTVPHNSFPNKVFQ